MQLPYLDKITFKVIEDSTTAEAALKSGDIDIFSDFERRRSSHDFRDDARLPDGRADPVHRDQLPADRPAKAGPVRRRPRALRAVEGHRPHRSSSTSPAAGFLQLANGLFSPGQEGYLDDNGFITDQDIDGAKALIADYQKDHPGPGADHLRPHRRPHRRSGTPSC